MLMVGANMYTGVVYTLVGAGTSTRWTAHGSGGEAATESEQRHAENAVEDWRAVVWVTSRPSGWKDRRVGGDEQHSRIRVWDSERGGQGQKDVSKRKR